MVCRPGELIKEKGRKEVTMIDKKLLIIITFIMSALSAETICLSGSASDVREQPAEIAIVTNSVFSVTFTVKIPGIQLSAVSYEGTEYKKLSINGLSNINTRGVPSLHEKTFLMAVP